MNACILANIFPEFGSTLSQWQGLFSIKQSSIKILPLITVLYMNADCARKKAKTYSRDSLVVTHPTTNRPACGLSTVNNQVGVSKGCEMV